MYKPSWLVESINLYKNNISNTFILTGNIGDYGTTDTIHFKDFLINFLLQEMDIRKDEVYLYLPFQGATEIRSRNEGLTLPEIANKMSNPRSNDAFIFYYPEYLIPRDERGSESSIIALHNILNSSSYVTSKNITFFITESASNVSALFLGNNCRSTLLNVDLPNSNERFNFISNYFSLHSSLKNTVRFEPGVDYTVFTNLTAGLQYIDIEDIILYANSKGRISQKMIMEKKKEVIQKEFGEIIELFDTNGYSLSRFAGQENIKQYFKETVIDAIKNDDIDIVPKGVMLMGPPGTGKTYFARCLAGDCGINFIEFKMSKILGKYVGESERAMEKALSVFRALAPVGVFMDEIDQSMSRSEGGSDGASSVNANLFGMLLSEMSKPENRGKIIWLAATNYPNKVDEALKRAGRFDKKIPFFAPSKSERVYVFSYHLKSKGMTIADDVDIDSLAEDTEGYTQAEIEAIVVKALELSKRAKQRTITQDKLELALEYMLSNQNYKIKEMEDIALKECNDQEFIPKEYRERHKELMTVNSVNSSFDKIDRGINRR